MRLLSFSFVIKQCHTYSLTGTGILKKILSFVNLKFSVTEHVWDSAQSVHFFALNIPNILNNIIRKIKVNIFKIYYSGLSGWLSAVRDSTQIDWALAKITLSLTECYSGQHSDKYITTGRCGIVSAQYIHNSLQNCLTIWIRSVWPRKCCDSWNNSKNIPTYLWMTFYWNIRIIWEVLSLECLSMRWTQTGRSSSNGLSAISFTIGTGTPWRNNKIN